MKNPLKRKELISIAVTVIVSCLAVAGIVSAVTTIGDNVSVGGTFHSTGAATASSTLMVTGAITTYGNVTLGDAAGDLILSTGALHASSTLQATGAITFYGNTTLGDADSDTLTVRAGDWSLTSTATTTVALTNGINFDSNTFVIDPTSNSVGILTATPAYTLDVNGTLRVTGLTTLGNASTTLASFGGGTTISGLRFGSCTVAFGGALTAYTASTTNCAATGVTTSDKVFLTPAGLETNICFNSASSTASDIIQVQVFSSTSTNVTMSAHTWYWMAIR